MSEGYVVTSLEEIEAVKYHMRDGERLIPVQHALDYRAAGVNGWIGDAGETVVPEHDEDEGEELYVVVRGRATFTVDGKTVDAPAGTLIHVEAAEKRRAVAEEDGTLLLVMGGIEGKAPGPSAWTPWIVADAYRREGRIDDGRAAIGLLLDRFDLWFAPYNAACYEALVGETDAAFAHLREAVARDPDAARDLARRDDDLASLHDDPRWQEVVG